MKFDVVVITILGVCLHQQNVQKMLLSEYAIQKDQ